MIKKHRHVKTITSCLLIFLFLNCNIKKDSRSDNSKADILEAKSIVYLNGDFNNIYSNYDYAFSNNTSGKNVDLGCWLKITFSKSVDPGSVTTESRDYYSSGGNIISNGSIHLRRTHIGTNSVNQNDPRNIVILKIIEWTDDYKNLILKPLNQHYAGDMPASENYYGIKPNSTYSIKLTADIKDFDGKPINLKKIKAFSYSTSNVDWGLYFMTKKLDDGYVYSEKYVPGRANEYFKPEDKTIFWTHGYESNTTKDDCRRENFLYHIPNGEGDSWTGHDVLQYIIDDGWNFAVFYWNQFADETSDVKDCESKIWNAAKKGGNANNGRYGTRYKTQTKYGTDQIIEVDDPEFNGPIEPLAIDFYKQYLSAMKNNSAKKRIIGHSNGGQMIIPVAWLITKNIFEGNIEENFKVNRLVIQEGFWSNGNKTYFNAPENSVWGFQEDIDTSTAVQIYIDNIKTWQPGIAIEQDKFQNRLCGDLFFIGARNFGIRGKTCIKYVYPTWVADNGFGTEYRHLYSKKYYFWTYKKSIHENITRNGGVTSRTNDLIINQFMNNETDNKVFKQIDEDLDDGNSKKTPYPGDDQFERIDLGNY